MGCRTGKKNRNYWEHQTYLKEPERAAATTILKNAPTNATIADLQWGLLGTDYNIDVAEAYLIGLEKGIAHAASITK